MNPEKETELLDTNEPVIVYGALRSGTTLFHLMLDAHHGISNNGEFDFLFSHAKIIDGKIIYDVESLRKDFMFEDSKLKLNDGLSGEQLFSDLLQQIRSRKSGVFTFNTHHDIEHVIKFLPNARFIHLVRDPRDVAKSCIQMGWAGNIYHAANHWIDIERAWQRVRDTLPQSHYIEIRYEDLLRDPTTTLAKVCAFLGVEYDPVMLTYSSQSTYSAPNPNMANKWKKAMSARDIRLSSVKAQELIRSSGYEVPADLKMPGPIERLFLGIENKIGIWTFGIRRYSARLYLGEKLTRWCGLSSIHDRIIDRMNEISREIYQIGERSRSRAA